MDGDWLLGLGLVLTSITTALVGVLLVHYLPARAARMPGQLAFGKTEDTVFLFDGETLLDASSSARALLASGGGRGAAWPRLMAYLNGRIDDVSAALLRLPAEGMVSLAADPARGEALLMVAELRGGLTRITLHDLDAEHSPVQHDPISYRAQTEELAMLRGMVAAAPVLIWRQNKAGEVYWANQAYLSAAALFPGAGEAIWPLPQIFEATAAQRPEAGQRQKLTRTDGSAAWYDLASIAAGEGRVCFGLPADATVQAEASLRDFMQTLTKTFAQLPIGLAIFDANRKLQVFNPALLDLTALPIDFLSSRPSIMSVLDGMRDRNMIPEPRDYRSWRHQLTEMEKATAARHYEETWNLPGGQTYRVTGRPHPNGALALIIEDISSEMLRTRRYKADMELGQAVLDDLSDAVAVFSAEGQLVMTNSAYSALWGHDPAETVSAAGVANLCRYWADLSAPSPLWLQIETYVANPGDRLRWNADVRLSDGRLMDCALSPLHGGATLIRFRLTGPGQPRPAEETPLVLSEAQVVPRRA